MTSAFHVFSLNTKLMNLKTNLWSAGWEWRCHGWITTLSINLALYTHLTCSLEKHALLCQEGVNMSPPVGIAISEQHSAKNAAQKYSSILRTPLGPPAGTHPCTIKLNMSDAHTPEPMCCYKISCSCLFSGKTDLQNKSIALKFHKHAQGFSGCKSQYVEKRPAWRRSVCSAPPPIKTQWSQTLIHPLFSPDSLMIVLLLHGFSVTSEQCWQ